MGQIIGLVSGKGGVGKTTVTACLGAALSKKGHRVLMTDGDFGLRDLDLVLGKENEVFFDAIDVYTNKNVKKDAIVTVSDDLDFLPASQSHRWEEVGRKKYRNMIQKISKDYDYVLIDAPAGIGRGADTILDIAERILVITQPLWVSLRNAGRMIQVCREKRKFDYAVVFNSMHQCDAINMDMQTMMDSIGAEYIGTILPYTAEVIEYTQDGHLHELQAEAFITMLSPLVAYVETGYTWEDEDILKSYDSFDKVELSDPENIPVVEISNGDSEPLEASVEEVVKKVSVEPVVAHDVDYEEDEHHRGSGGEKVPSYSGPRIVLTVDDEINHTSDFKALWKQCGVRNRKRHSLWRKRR